MFPIYVMGTSRARAALDPAATGDAIWEAVKAEAMSEKMDDKAHDVEELTHRVQELQRERDELRKDIEQLCMQQSGPGYVSVATRMLSQRATALEQDIENLQKKLAGCLRENHNLQEELAEAYRVKSQLADLYGAELSKMPISTPDAADIIFWLLSHLPWRPAHRHQRYLNPCLSGVVSSTSLTLAGGRHAASQSVLAQALTDYFLSS